MMAVSMGDLSGITVTVAGNTYTGFTGISATTALDQAARTFQLMVASELGAMVTARMFAEGAPVIMHVDGELWLTGYVDRYQPHIGAREASITVTGRSKGQDAIDSSVIHKTGYFENRTPLDIAKELDLSGVGFSANDNMDPLGHFQVTPGETVFQAVERLARDQAYSLHGKPDGSIEFWRAKGTLRRQSGPLIEGFNIKSADADHNWAKRHSHYHVRGQSAQGANTDVTQLEAVARDDAVQRYRPTVILAEGDTDAPRVKKRAGHHRNTRAGRSLSAQIDVVGYRDSGGTLWTCGNLVYVESDFLALKQDMLIEQVSVSENSNGQMSKLHLCDPRAYGGDKRKASKSGGEWDFSDEAPE